MQQRRPSTADKEINELSLFFLEKRVDRIEFSKKPEPVPSVSGLSEVAACPPSPIAEDPSAPPSPSSSQ